jgi:choline dehydrogenase-like flavoprotein
MANLDGPNVGARSDDEHAVIISGGGPTGLMLAGELALAGVEVAIVERRPSQDVAGSRAGGLRAPSRYSISGASPTDSSQRGRRRRSPGLPGFSSISAAFPRAILTVSGYGKDTSSGFSPAGSTSSKSGSIAASS